MRHFLHGCRGQLLSALLILMMMVPCFQGKATVIFYVYTGGAVYVGADSLVAFNGINAGTMDKIGRFTDTCSVAIAHNYGTSPFLPAELGKLIASTSSKNEPLAVKIEEVVSNFYPIYARSFGGQSNCDTWVEFSGFDPERKNFFLTAYEFDSTNNVKVVPGWEVPLGVVTGQIYMTGQETFLQALLGPAKFTDDKLKGVRTPKFMDIRGRILAGSAVSDDEMRDWMLDVFDADEKLAIPLGFDTRQIGGPYRILKITAGDMTLLH